jgi:deferrochelatase/peroxidase EfeB
MASDKSSTQQRRFRSRDWFDDPKHLDMVALYLERFMNYGLTANELLSGKPIIGIAQTGGDLTPCNRVHLDTVKRVREGIRDAGGVPMEFPLHPIFENCLRPTAALDRNLAYLGLVEILHGYPIDAVVLTTGCDKTTPAQIMAASTVDIPAIVLSGGPMLDGWHDGDLVGSGTVIWRSRRKLAAGQINEKQFLDAAAASAPSLGHCNTMGTASTMNAVAEVLGLSLPGCAAIPAPYRERGQISYETGRRIVELEADIAGRPHRAMLREAGSGSNGLDRCWGFDGPPRQADAVITGALGPRALTKLGLPEDCLSGFPAAYLDGMAARAHILGDVDGNAVSEWSWGQEPPDVALLIYGDSAEAVAILEQRIRDLANSLDHTPIHRIPLEELTEEKAEPFGFVDGISQPAMRGTYKGLRTRDPIHLVEPGEFVLGYPDNRGNIPPGPTLSALLDPHNRLPIELRAHHDFASNIVNAGREIGRNGSFLVIRQLAQDIGAFETYCRSEAARLEDRLGPPNRIDEEFIAAKLVGRWRNGSSLVRHPHAPARHGGTGEQGHRAVSRPKSNPDGKPAIEAPGGPSARADNDFLFGDEDAEALRCPFGAHIRRANPRDSFDPGSRDQIDISNRHRLLRVGRPYRPHANEHPGLLFMCLNGDIERQFEFIQQTWLGSPSFHGLVGEEDPITAGSRDNTGFLIPSRDGPVRLSPLRRFVTTRGGGYFFLPSKRLLYFLAGDE